MVHHTGTAAYLTRVRNPRVPNGYQSRALVDTTASVTAGVGSSMEILSGEGQQPSSERQPEQETAQRSRSTSMVVSLIDIQSAVAAEHFLCAIHCGHPEVMTKEFLAIVDGSMNAVLQDGGQGFWDFAGYRFRKPARLGIEYGGLSTVIIGTQIAATAIPILGFVFGAVAFGGIAVTAWKQNSSGKRSQEEIFEERYKFPLFRLLKGKAWWAPRRACPRTLPAARVFLSAFAFFSWLCSHTSRGSPTCHVRPFRLPARRASDFWDLEAGDSWLDMVLKCKWSPLWTSDQKDRLIQRLLLRILSLSDDAPSLKVGRSPRARSADELSEAWPCVLLEEAVT